MAQDATRPGKRWFKTFAALGTRVGKTAVGATRGSNGTSTTQDAVKVTSVPAATYGSISVYMDIGTITGRFFQFALYSDVAGVPTTLLAWTINSDAISISNSATQPGWVTLRFPSPVTLAAGTYWIAVPGLSGGSSRGWYYDTGSAGDSFDGGTGITGGPGGNPGNLPHYFPTTWAGGASGTRDYTAFLNTMTAFTPTRVPIVVYVTMIGGGGGGGGCARDTGVVGAAGGGGAGEAVFRYEYYIASGSIWVEVGQPGSAGLGGSGATQSGGVGGTGGVSQFGILICRGGVGGVGSVAGQSGGQGGGASGGGTLGGVSNSDNGYNGGCSATGSTPTTPKTVASLPFSPGGGGGAGGRQDGITGNTGGKGGSTAMNIAKDENQGGVRPAVAYTNAGNGGIGGVGNSPNSASGSGGGGGGGGNFFGNGGAGGAGALSGSMGAAGNVGIGYGAGGVALVAEQWPIPLGTLAGQGHLVS